jgi:hypothetical protein
MEVSLVKLDTECGIPASLLWLFPSARNVASHFMIWNSEAGKGAERDGLDYAAYQHSRERKHSGPAFELSFR